MIHISTCFYEYIFVHALMYFCVCEYDYSGKNMCSAACSARSRCIIRTQAQGRALSVHQTLNSETDKKGRQRE